MSFPFYHQNVPVLVRCAQVVGITTAAGMAGFQIGLTTFSVPALLKAPAPLLAQQWADIYNRGLKVVPPLSLIPAVTFGYLAYRSYSIAGPNFGLYTVAAVLSPGVAVFTATIMKSNVDTLLGRARSIVAVAAEQEQSTHQLVDTWGLLNLGRSMLPLLSAVLATWAALDPVEVVAVQGIEVVGGANRLG